jgi:hypothetical protein
VIAEALYKYWIRSIGMKLRFIFFFVTLLSFIQGCSGIQGLTGKTQTSVPVTNPTLAFTPNFTPTIMPSLTPTLEIRASLTPVNTGTATLAPLPAYQQSCLALLPQLPAGKAYSGKLVLSGRGGAQNYPRGHLFDLATRQTTLMFPEKAGSITVSPDRTKYAVEDLSDNRVKIYSADGVLLGILDKGQYPYIIDQWIDNEQLLIGVLESEGRWVKYPEDEILFNIFTGKQTLLHPDYPDIDLGNTGLAWTGGSTTKYDPSLTLVVYPSYTEQVGGSPSYVLYDRVRKEKITEKAVKLFWTTPIWSPDGSKFAINDSAGDGEFYVITREGVISKVSHFNGDDGKYGLDNVKFSDQFSWSPDGRYLAFWLDAKLYSYSGTFAILDTQTGETTDYCLPSGSSIGTYYGWFYSNYQPIWSLDGKYVVTIANQQENGDYDTVLIDLTQRVAAKIAENLVPIGWLDTAKK